MKKTPIISLIVAAAKNGAIGKDGKLLWHIPEDMRYFREVTQGKPVIMGRKTWESLPERFKPLPGRKNIVISHWPDYPADGAHLATSLEAALRESSDETEVFIIGGAQIYQYALPLAHRVYLTQINTDYEADAFFPGLDLEAWQEVSRRPGQENHEVCFVIYERRGFF